MTHRSLIHAIGLVPLAFGLYLAPLSAGAQVPDTAPAAQIAAVTPAVPAPSAAPESAVVPTQAVLKAGLNLSSQLQRLAAPVGWQVIWEAPDFLVEQSVTLGGDFFQVTVAIVDSIQATGTPVKATFYKGNQILRIVGE